MNAQPPTLIRRRLSSWARQAQAEHAVLQLRLDPVWVDPVGQGDAAGERAAPALSPVVGLLPLGRRAAAAAQGQRVPVRLDLEVVLLHARQLRLDCDAVRAGIDVHDGKPAAGRRAVGVRKALHLILEPAQLAEGVRAAEEAEGAQGGHRSFLPIKIDGRAVRPSVGTP